MSGPSCHPTSDRPLPGNRLGHRRPPRLRRSTHHRSTRTPPTPVPTHSRSSCGSRQPAGRRRSGDRSTRGNPIKASARCRVGPGSSSQAVPLRKGARLSATLGQRLGARRGCRLGRRVIDQRGVVGVLANPPRDVGTHGDDTCSVAPQVDPPKWWTDRPVGSETSIQPRQHTINPGARPPPESSGKTRSCRTTTSPRVPQADRLPGLGPCRQKTHAASSAASLTSDFQLGRSAPTHEPHREL